MEKISPAPVVIIANRPSRKFLIAGVVILMLTVLAIDGYFLYIRYLSPKAQALNQIDKIINLIKNPDLNLLQKYQVSPSRIEQEQIIIICGGYIRGKVPDDEQQCTPDSLFGIKNVIKAGNTTLAKNLILQIYPRIQNPMIGGPNGEGLSNRMTKDQARQLDPDKRFLFYPPDGSDPLYGGSVIKWPAAVETMKFWYSLNSKKSL